MQLIRKYKILWSLTTRNLLKVPTKTYTTKIMKLNPFTLKLFQLQVTESRKKIVNINCDSITSLFLKSG